MRIPSRTLRLPPSTRGGEGSVGREAVAFRRGLAGIGRWVFAFAFTLLAGAAFAQRPPGINPVTGARPGNEIGTGSSLPLSDKPGNITPSDTGSLIAGRLPEPSAGEDATILRYLLSARGALAAGRDGEAQEALERAETRALDRAVPLFQTGTPSGSPMVTRIHNVLLVLGGGDRMEAMRQLEQAIAVAGP